MNLTKVVPRLSALALVSFSGQAFAACPAVASGSLGVGDVTLDALATQGSRTPIGGTIIANGTSAVDAAGNLSVTLTDVCFEYGEHVILGPLVSVDPVAGTFVVNGTTVRMNQDVLLPSDLFDLGFNPIGVSDMVGFEGTLVAVQGWWDGSFLNGTLVETEVVVANPVVDTVALDRARWTQSRGQLEVRGLVSFLPGTTTVAASVTIDPSCDGVGTIAVAVVPDVTGGTFTYRSANNAYRTNPGTAPRAWTPT
jgi:hypothetical protein